MKRTSTHLIAECLITDGTNKTNHEWMKIVATLLSEYFQDKYGDNAENIFDCDDRHDMNYLMTEYGVKNAVTLAVDAQYGYVIAGYNLPIDKCIIMHEDNFWEVLNQFWDLIDERIEYYFDNEKYSWEDIERIFPSLDIKKYIFGDERFIVRKETKHDDDSKGTAVQCAEFTTRVGAENWIFSELKALMDYKKDFNMYVSVDEDIYEFQDVGNKIVTTFEFIDYTDRERIWFNQPTK